MSEFERWQARYANEEVVFGDRPNVFLKRQAALLPWDGRVLAVADGGDATECGSPPRVASDTQKVEGS